MVKAWQAGGPAKKALLEKWTKTPDVSRVTLEMVEEDIRRQLGPQTSQIQSS